MKRILIIKPSSMGDVLHTFPAVNGLKQVFPGVEIDWVIHPAFEELLDYLPLDGRKILFRRKELGNIKTFFSEFKMLKQELRKESYDAVLDLQGLFRSAILGVLTGCPRRFGPAEAREYPAKFCYTHTLPWKKETRHALEKNCDMVSAFLNGREISAHYTLPPVEKFVKNVNRILEQESVPVQSGFLAMAPGARWVTKQWDRSCFAECAEILYKKMPSCHFLLLGSPSEKELCTGIAKDLAGKVPCTDLCAKTSMGELLEIIRRAGVLICNDSGPMHAAACAGTPAAAFFAPTDPVLTGPYSEKSIVLRPELDCLNCFRRQCPSGECRRAVSPGKMAAAVLELLQQERKNL
ncbi:MAG: glycosyltransferase family 9 protein [Lentisphaeria bacterium]|nr:glycosyltransferase family 9 protein [Lentisphaeria bacterium]